MPIFDQDAPAALCAHLACLLRKRAYPEWTDHAEAILKAGTLEGAMAIATWASRDPFWSVKLAGMAAFARFIASGQIVMQWNRAGSPGATKAATMRHTVSTAAPSPVSDTTPAESITALLNTFPAFNTAGRVANNFLSDSSTRARSRSRVL